MHDDIESTDSLTPAQRELEAALRTLAPAAPAIDRDRLMFEAGVASARPSVHRWRGATAAAGAIAALLVVALGVSLTAGQRDPQVVREVVYVERPETVRPSSAPSSDIIMATDAAPAFTTSDALLLSSGSPESNYLSMRDRALRWGVGAALPTGHAVARPSDSPDVNQLLGMPSGAQPESPARAPLRSLKDLLPFGDSL
jgi:hypothetical protein